MSHLLPSLCRAGTTAVLAALAGTAAAQSSVTIYGIADAQLRVERGPSDTLKSVGSGLSRGSRLGFRISEDMGGDLRALATLEMGYNLDDGQMLATGAPAPGFGRQSFVAIGGKSTGFVSLGRQYTPIFALSASALDAFSASYLGTLTTTQNAQGGLTPRTSNSVAYTYNYAAATDSPTPRTGFSLAALAAAGEGTGPRQYGMTIAYGQDRWFAGYATHVIDGTATSRDPQQTSHLIGGTYRFDWATLFASLHRTSNDATGAALISRNNWSVGARIPVGRGQVIAQHQDSDDRSAANRDFSNFSVAYEYPFSRRTIAYVNYGRNSNNAVSAIPLSLGRAVTPGFDPQALAIGMRHSF